MKNDLVSFLRTVFVHLLYRLHSSLFTDLKKKKKKNRNLFLLQFNLISSLHVLPHCITITFRFFGTNKNLPIRRIIAITIFTLQIHFHSRIWKESKFSKSKDLHSIPN